MIEVEKKFQPTAEQLKKLLAGADFLGEKKIHDIYYDYPDYRYFKKDIKLRNRNGSFELKINKSETVSLEIENEEEIKKYFKTEQNLAEFVKNNFIIVADFENERKKYKKGEFAIDVDKMSFSYELCEIELLVEKETEVKKAEEKIIKFAKGYDLEVKKIPGKGATYLKLVKPEIYKEIYD